MISQPIEPPSNWKIFQIHAMC